MSSNNSANKARVKGALKPGCGSQGEGEREGEKKNAE